MCLTSLASRETILGRMFPPDTRFLIVEDSEIMLGMIKSEINKLGYRDVLTFSDALEALSALTVLSEQGSRSEQQLRRTVILSDLSMPRMSGLEFLKRLKSTPRFSDIPFIMITTEGDRFKVLEVLTTGATSYLIKPFNHEKLKLTLENTWKKSNPIA